jgi:hypothetical protein
MIADQSNKVNVMAERIYGTLRPAAATRKHGEAFLLPVTVRETGRKIFVISAAWRTIPHRTRERNGRSLRN